MASPSSAVATSAFAAVRYGGRLGLHRKKFSPWPTCVLNKVGGPQIRPPISRVQPIRFQGTLSSNPPPPPSTPNQTPNSDSSSTAPPSSDKPPKSLPYRIASFILLSIIFTTAGFTMAAAPAVQTAADFLKPPTDAETLDLYSPDNEELSAIESQLHAHPLTRSLTADPKWIPSRPHLKIPANLRAQNLTGGTLLGTDKIAVPPLQFNTRDGSEFVSLQYLGPALCGHPGIVHGGLLATILDEGLARCCFAALPNKVGVTASLKIDYRKPCMAGQFVVLKAETTKVEGRKAWVKGKLETLVDEGRGEVPVVLAEAEALFVEPKQAAALMKVYSTQ